jgi:hypothetical protein
MSADRDKVKRATRAIIKAVPDVLLGDIRQLIEEAAVRLPQRSMLG